MTAPPPSARAQATVNSDAKARARELAELPWKKLGRSDEEWARSGWWNDAVFYQIFLRSFQDSSTGPLSGDGIGDIPGLIERLDYLNDGRPAEGKPPSPASLGVTGLWLMPIHPSPGYHGYEVDDFHGVNPQFGTMEDFKRLVEECHKRGIRVILDLVLNHVSWKHPWFVDASTNPRSKHRDWFTWSDKVPDWKGPWNQQVWWRAGSQPGPGAAVEPGATDGPFYYGIFYLTMPDVNYRNPDASNAMLDAVRFWLTQTKVDGYRLDAIRHLIENGDVQENTPETHEWLRGFFRAYKQANPKAFTVGEVWANSAQAAAYVGDQLDTVFEFDLSYAMVDSAKSGKAERFMNAQRTALDYFPQGQYGRFLSNHDQTRIMTSLKGDWGAMRVAAAMLLLGPGVPFIYYGEEIGMTGDKPDELIRTPMQWAPGAGAGFTTGTPWQPPNADTSWKNVEAQSAGPGSLLNLYRQLIALRASMPALRHGLTTLLECDRASVAAFIRHTRGGKDGAGVDRPAQTALVVINLGAQPIAELALSAPGSPLAGRFAGVERLNAGGPVAELGVGTGGSIEAYQPLPRLEPRTAYVVELTPLR
jgi:glycosidase